jgi:gliding motility-associated-like protein
VTFKPNPEPIVVVKGSTTLCAGQLASFEVVDQPVATLVWSGPNGFSSEGPTASVVVSPQTAGIYFVSSSLDGCPGAPVSVVLTNAPQPKLILTADSLVCKGSRKPVQVASDSGATYFWSNNVSAAQTELGVGTHWVEVLLNGCRVRDTFQIRNSGPTAAFTTVPDSLLQVYQEVRFLDQSLAGTSAITNWEWNLGFSQIRTIQNPAFTYQANGPVDIQLIVRDNAGCTDTLIRTLEILPQQGWLIPSLFTPNNDGENDSFELGDLSKYPGTKVNIFDRWGKEQFSSSDYKNDWKGGDLVEGVYYYHVARSDGQSFQGYVYLRR